MGATGPLVLISEPVKSRKVSEPVLPTQSAEAAAVPGGGTLGATTAAGAAATARPERRSMRKKAPNSPNGDPPMFPPDLQRHDSKMSISQISMGSPMPPHLRPDTEVPELSYGSNPRAPSASIGIDLRFAPEKGRFFVASQDLLPGKICKYVHTMHFFQPFFRALWFKQFLQKSIQLGSPYQKYKC